MNLKPEYLKMLTNIFEEYCPKAEIWAYGSRVNGDSHNGSDLDLAVKSFNNSDCNIFELKNKISDSNIPFLVDILEFENLPESFQKEITKNYVVIFG